MQPSWHSSSTARLCDYPDYSVPGIRAPRARKLCQTRQTAYQINEMSVKCKCKCKCSEATPKKFKHSLKRFKPQERPTNGLRWSYDQDGVMIKMELWSRWSYDQDGVMIKMELWSRWSQMVKIETKLKIDLKTEITPHQLIAHQEPNQQYLKREANSESITPLESGTVYDF